MTRKQASSQQAVDLFAGCGGLTEGLKQAGFSVVAAVELDGQARETYALNHPDVWLAGTDIRETDPAAILKRLGLKRGDLGLLAGCPPCQGFSRIRKKNKVRASRDGRNTLIDDFGRFVEGMLPKCVMMENVPGLASHFRLTKLHKKLTALGYTTKTEIVDVAAYQVPQRRKRLIFVASLDGAPMLATPSKKRITVRQTIASLPRPSKSEDGLHALGENRTQKVKNLISAIPKNGGSRTDLPKGLRLACHERVAGFFDVYGRMRWDDVSPTITGGCHNPSKGRFLHPSQDRTITLREAALLQGFPADYKFNLAHGKEAIALMIGNALPPPFIAVQARCLLRRARRRA